MSDEYEQTVKRNEEQIRQNQALLDKAQAVLDEHAQMFTKLGVTREGAKRYLESAHFTEQERKQVQEQVAQFEAEIDRDIAAAEQAQTSQSHPAHPRKVRNRNMI